MLTTGSAGASGRGDLRLCVLPEKRDCEYVCNCAVGDDWMQKAEKVDKVEKMEGGRTRRKMQGNAAWWATMP
jgi:hypothetical protein